MDYDGSDTILREESVPGLHQLGDMDVRKLHPVIRIEDWTELAKFSWSIRRQAFAGRTCGGHGPSGDDVQDALV